MVSDYAPEAERDRAQVWLDGPYRDIADRCAALLALRDGGKVTRVAAVRTALDGLLADLEGPKRADGG